jgi:lysophospholipase L1-like esterase
LGSGNIDIQGGGSSMSITYNANTQALVIGGGSMKYTITLTGNSSPYNISVNGESKQSYDFPLEVSGGGTMNFKSGSNAVVTITMGGNDITENTNYVTKTTEGFTKIWTISNIVGDVVVSSNASGGGVSD